MARAKQKRKSSTRSVRPPAPANDDGAQLSGRPIWEGHLRLSLVSCPVALYSATSHANNIAFHLLNPRTQNRIRMIATDPDTGPVERADLVKGYEIAKNRYVTVTSDELNAVKLETTHTLDIERFVDAADIDRLYWNTPFYLVPSGDNAVEAYVVIREAMAASGRIALGRLVMHTRERLMAVEPRGRGLIVTSLRMADEVIDPDEAFRNIPTRKPDKGMVEIADKIIAQQAGPFDATMFKDRYEQALRDLVRRKQRGEKIVTAEPPPDTNVIDLMDALKKSLKHRSKAPAQSTKRKRSAR